jgi:dipeptidyl aminopeptidase/acylaminoacyl peptidase
LELRYMRAGKHEELLASLGVHLKTDKHVPAKNLYRVAPDGRHLAVLNEDGSGLRLYDATGEVLAVSGAVNFRFSPDGRSLAVARTTGSGGEDILLVDLKRRPQSSRRVLGHVSNLGDMEWVAGGLVVSQQAFRGDALLYLPLYGRARTIPTPSQIQHIAAAARGSRVLVFGRNAGDDGMLARVYLVDVNLAGSPRRLSSDAYEVQNAELSPDGSRALFSTRESLFHIDFAGSGVPRSLRSGGPAHAIWFSDDGKRYLYASREGVVVRGGGKTWSYRPGVGQFATARFVAGGDVLLLVNTAHGSDWYRWDLGQDRRQPVMTTLDRDLDGDLFNGLPVRLLSVADVPAPIWRGRVDDDDLAL